MEPDLLLFEDYGGDWNAYEAELSRIFMADIASGHLIFRGWPVRAKQHPRSSNQWFSFWHLVQEGRVEDDREPNIRRCERIKWPAYIISTCDTNGLVHCWSNERRNERNVLLWYKEEYLVVLSRRNQFWLLKTAYCTDRKHRVADLRRERDKYRAKHGGV